jgi:Holliday junction DNA helicase RuvB
VLKLDFYSDEEIGKILLKNSQIIQLNLDEKVIHMLAKRARGTPRIANRILKIIRDYHIIGKNIYKSEDLENIFYDIGIDSLGLDYLDRKYLQTLLEKFA